MEPTVTIYLGYLASIFMGLVLGTLGGGGSILTVPILVYLFKLNPIQATTYSLFVVGSTALFGGLGYYKKNEVDFKTGAIFAIPSFFGVTFSRGYLVPNLPDPILTVGNTVISKPLFMMAVFSILMVLASISMIKTQKDNSRKEISATKKLFLISLQGLFVGCITGFVGAGGGFLIIPALVLLVGLAMKTAVGTSLFIIAANSLIGFLSGIRKEAFIDWKLLLSVSAVAFLGLLLGLKISDKIPQKNLKKGFGYFVLIMGTFILIDQIKNLLAV